MSRLIRWLRLSVPFCLLALFLAYGPSPGQRPHRVAVPPTAANSHLSTAEVVAAAEAVIALMRTDNVQAAKGAYAVFLAANRLVADSEFAESIPYFETGIQLYPWDMQQQLNYAHAVKVLGDIQQAASIARMVAETTETAALLHEAQELAAIKPPGSIPSLPDDPFDRPVIALVRMGDVDDWIVQQAGEQLQDTLGTPVYLDPLVLPLPPPHRGRMPKWLDSLTSNAVQDSPIAKRLIDRFFFRQWDASQLWGILLQQSPERTNVTYIGITQIDIYSGRNNFVFGFADVGSGYAVVSTLRFEAKFNGERENQQRFLRRLHKQLLSSVGFAYGISRPMDPRSARSYPNGLADHDLKGTWLSREDIEAFEKVLGHRLPEATWQASRAHW